MGERAPQLRQIYASAGSGKTYTLTGCFLDFLARSSIRGDPTTCCRVSRPDEHSWSEILAITFTNQAAMEMQERIIARLKDTALGAGQAAPGWTAAKAKAWLTIILRQYGMLNVRTIDSLLHLVVHLSALELNLPPDFTPVFSHTEALAPLLDTILEESRQDPELHQLLSEACRDVFFAFLSSRRGFIPEKYLRDTILDLAIPVMEKQKKQEQLSSPAQIAERMDSLLTSLHHSAEQLEAILAAESLRANTNLYKALTACRKCTVRDNAPDSKMLARSCLNDCLLKASKGQASAEAELAFANLIQCAQTVRQELPLLRQAQSLMPLVRLTQKLSQRIPDYIRQEGYLPTVLMPDLARQALSNQYGVSEMLCRLGTRLTHLLVDEFQDTSLEQWETIKQFVLEALSRGGSLTWVGDVKQAIYGWRGGKAELFDAVRQDPELLAIAPNPQITSLPTNWRSATAIVETNNRIFTQLSQPDIARAVLTAVLPRRIQEQEKEKYKALLTEEQNMLMASFSNALQKSSPGRIQGHVRLYRLKDAASTHDLQEQIHLQLMECMADLATRRQWGDVAVLVPTNDNAQSVAEWLLRAGIPVVTDNSFLLTEHPLVNGLINLLKFMDSPAEDSAFWAFLCGGQLLLPLTGLHEQQLFEWACKQHGRKRTAPLCLTFRDDFPEVWRRWVAPFYAGAGLLTPYDAVCEGITHLRVRERFPDEMAFVRRLLEILHLAEGDGYNSMSSFLAYWGDKGKEEKAPMPETLDAVRVMTIHKAKGLQFPVVLVPWTNFSLQVTGKIKDIRVGELALFIRQNSRLGLEYYRALLDKAREALHMLYVAWTRPEEELHTFLAHRPAGQTRASLAEALDILLSPLSEEDMRAGISPSPAADHSQSEAKEATAPVAALPEPEEAASTEKTQILTGKASFEETEELPWRPMSWLPRLKIFRNPLDDFALTGKRRGTLIHQCLSYLQLNSGNTVAEAVRLAVNQGIRSFPLSIADQTSVQRDLEDILAWYASLPQTAYWLQHGTAEQSIVDEAGNLFRADLVVNNGAQVTVAEYKTGAPTPAHRQQLTRYMRLVAQATHLPTDGVLIYLDLKRLDRQTPIVA